MKGYIAFCPHFHQPHFQLHRTREETFKNSYQPWLELLQEAAQLENFFINLHFSGPFLYWFREQKQSYLHDLKKLLASGRIGLIGGLADEPFIQLSSRSDDCLYQLKKYDELCSELFGVQAPAWQGIHLVERECGEYLLSRLTQAAHLLGAPAIYYLDAETFYRPHFYRPGGMSDYCLRHFGFKDPVSMTTISHIPDEMLYFGLQDEINGQFFQAVPVHTQFRYQLLKRNAFTADDNVQIKPVHYYFYIKDALEQAAKFALQYGREISPLLVIFEDAEKMGQWSKDAAGDRQWLLEFFRLVNDDPELDFIGLRDYLEREGVLDSYPAASSHSYPEWENWTAGRGIRGVTYGDERLRRVISRLRVFETKQERFEHTIVTAAIASNCSERLQDMQVRAVMNSLERYEFIEQILQDQYPLHYLGYYKLINRVRNLVYQEDPKWASRHPSYGSSPYYDMQGLAYLEIASRLLGRLADECDPGADNNPEDNVFDWDFDGRDEILWFNRRQSLAIDPQGGCITYHHVLAPGIGDDMEHLGLILQRDFDGINAYHSVYRHACPLVMTETDSSLASVIFPEGARRENCRNSLRCSIVLDNNGQLTAIGDFDRSLYELEEITATDDGRRAVLNCTEDVTVGGQTGRVKLRKEFLLQDDSLSLVISACLENIVVDHLYLVPQIVSSAAPSDEVDFQPVAFLQLPAGEGNIEVIAKNAAVWTPAGMEVADRSLWVDSLQQVDYVFQIKTGHGDTFINRVSYRLGGGAIEKMEVRPAVEHYYKGFVFESQSQLGYQSSGFMLLPYIPFVGGAAEFKTQINWELDY
ncbi:MAG TPA: hypothetical protein VN441_06565, partial [Syntrophomonas sp.]|nr:hypothetical protein [Syntrophomonas sp.]